MKRSTFVASMAVPFCVGIAVTACATLSPMAVAAVSRTPDETSNSDARAALTCVSDLRALKSQMGKDGYWLGGSGYGYGYPMGNSGYGWYGTVGGGNPAANGYENARPGYEVRTLLAAANILAQHGQQKACETVVDTTRGIYQLYVADLHRISVPIVDVPYWQQRQIAAAQPVTGQNKSFRSDELLGTEVRNPKGEALGSIEDLLMSPQTGKIAYLVIGRGGVFGIGKKYVPVPWDSFEATPNVDLLVLDASEQTMNGAPQVADGRAMRTNGFEQKSQKVDEYWKNHMSNAEGN
jgi:sporulation protein YlmC with PRC-barrel domain